MSDEIKKKRPKILDALDEVAEILPTPLYWIDQDGIALGANHLVIQAVGAKNRNEYIGKSLLDIYPYEMALHIKLHNEKVMQTGKILSQEEPIRTVDTGEKKYYTAVKAPLRDEEGNVIGIIGTSIDITAEKEAEHLKFENLRLENEMQRQLLAEHEKFTKLAAQVAHDIRSPLAALNTALVHVSRLNENERIMLRHAVERINDIANNLLITYKHRDVLAEAKEKRLLPWLITPIIDSMLTEKRLQYANLGIVIEVTISDAGYCAFAKVELIEFKRVLSNLINNAAESLPKAGGKIIIAVDANVKHVTISIRDNGCGIPHEKLATIFEAKKTTKAEGYGLGLVHAKEKIEHIGGNIQMSSMLGEGTIVIITLPQTERPKWFVPEIVFNLDEQVIVLDDDESIHGAWDSRLQQLGLKKAVLHFHQGEDLLAWRKTHPAEEIFALSDYELLSEAQTGLDILETLNIGKHGVLITSHYEREEIVERCVNQGIALLPKNLVAHIPLRVNVSKEKLLEQLDGVLIDDDELMEQLWTFCAEQEGQKLKVFKRLKDLEGQLQHIPYSTPIYIDSNLKEGIKGEDYAKQLYEQGYKTIYLVTGTPREHFPPMPWIKKILGKTPEFLN